MARFEGDFRADTREPLSIDELIALLGNVVETAGGSRDDAIACALSASEGWQEAVKRLGGAFAEGAAGLKDRKGDLPGD